MNENTTVGIVGCGTMGTGIAIVCARAGFVTRVYDQREEALNNAKAQAVAFLKKSVERGKLAAGDDSRIMAQFSTTTTMADLSDCDFIIEAVFEDLKVKHTLFSELNKICPAHTIFASNTSTISITEIAGGSGRDDRVVGMHFCLPAQLMKLVEMSAGILTSPETFKTAWALTEQLGQIPVETRDDPGFILNALLVPFNNDAIRAVEAGVAEAGDIDKAIKVGLGYKMGPLELIDLIGLDTQIRLCEAFYGVTLDPRASAPPLLRRMVAAGLTGRKSGRGFFNYGSNAMFGA